VSTVSNKTVIMSTVVVWQQYYHEGQSISLIDR